MNFNKHGIQTLMGMSKSALQDHYELIKSDYLKLSGKDTRIQAYLMTVNSYIQLREKEENESGAE